MTTKADIDAYIASLPKERRTRMEQFQWRLDMELAKYKDPVARMNRMVELMWAGFIKLERVLQDPKSEMVQPTQTATVTHIHKQD